MTSNLKDSLILQSHSFLIFFIKINLSMFNTEYLLEKIQWNLSAEETNHNQSKEVWIYKLTSFAFQFWFHHFCLYYYSSTQCYCHLSTVFIVLFLFVIATFSTYVFCCFACHIDLYIYCIRHSGKINSNRLKKEVTNKNRWMNIQRWLRNELNRQFWGCLCLSS